LFIVLRLVADKMGII